MLKSEVLVEFDVDVGVEVRNKEGTLQWKCYAREHRGELKTEEVSSIVLNYIFITLKLTYLK